MSAFRRRSLHIAAWVFMLVFFARAGGLVLHEPLIGLANNYDMIRVQGCIDAYPIRDAQVLPATCAEHAGKDWFSPDVEQAHPCPEVFAVSRLALAKVLVHEPATLFAVLMRGIDEARPWITPLLGKIEGEMKGEVPAYFPSLSSAIAAMPKPLWRVVFLLPLALAPVFAFRPGGDRPSVAVRGLLVFLGSFPTLTLATVVFGDGFADVPKQFHLGMTSLLAFYLVTGGWLVKRSIDRPVTQAP